MILSPDTMMLPLSGQLMKSFQLDETQRELLDHYENSRGFVGIESIARLQKACDAQMRDGLEKKDIIEGEFEVINELE